MSAKRSLSRKEAFLLHVHVLQPENPAATGGTLAAQPLFWPDKLKAGKMLTQDYLGLRVDRLKHSDEWNATCEGLVFLFPSSGKGSYISGSVAQPFSAGDVLVFNTVGRGHIRAQDGHELEFRSFSVKLEHLFPLFANHEVHLIQDLQNRFKTSRVFPASTPVAIECHRLLASTPPVFNLDQRSHLLRVAAALLSAELGEARKKSRGAVGIDEHLDAVFEQLTTDEIVGLPIDDLAARFHCSRRHLNRLFHYRFGLSVSALRMELRLLKAASLLRDADAKVINVAEESGFNHLGLFNSCFKRRFGVSPGQWRERAPVSACEPGPVGVDQAGECRLRTCGLCPLIKEPAAAKALWPTPPQPGGPRVAVVVSAAKPRGRASGKKNGSSARPNYKVPIPA
jgi:AraC-like DNA-binding protein